MTIKDLKSLKVTSEHDRLIKEIILNIWNMRFPGKLPECTVSLFIDFPESVARKTFVIKPAAKKGT